MKGFENIARVCHEANRAYCHDAGDYSQRPWDAAPEWQKASIMAGVTMHLEALERGEEPTGEGAHEAWKAHKLADGWVYGPEKNEEAKTHPCLVDYDELPDEHLFKDYLFIAIVKTFWERGI